MGRFTKTFKHELDFDGDHVVVEMKRLTNKQMLSLAPHFREDQGVTKLSFADRLEVLSVTSEILPENVVSITGLKAADGTELKLSDIIHELYFGPVIDQLIGALLVNSTSEHLKVKKSVPPSPDTPQVESPANESKSAA